jgi:ketosteroid isomerase-like protein
VGRGGAPRRPAALDVKAGDDVAYAHALLRCGTPQQLAERPANRLRLTLGLRKQQGRWVVAHEHHSFPDVSDDPAQPVTVRLEQRARGTP